MMDDNSRALAAHRADQSTLRGTANDRYTAGVGVDANSCEKGLAKPHRPFVSPKSAE